MINSATDHGFSAEAPERTVRKGDIIRLRDANGIYEVRVLGPVLGNVDWCDVVVLQWITDVHPTRQSRLLSIEAHSRADLLAAKYAE